MLDVTDTPDIGHAYYTALDSLQHPAQQFLDSTAGRIVRLAAWVTIVTIVTMWRIVVWCWKANKRRRFRKQYRTTRVIDV